MDVLLAIAVILYSSLLIRTSSPTENSELKAVLVTVIVAEPDDTATVPVLAI